MFFHQRKRFQNGAFSIIDFLPDAESLQVNWLLKQTEILVFCNNLQQIQKVYFQFQLLESQAKQLFDVLF